MKRAQPDARHGFAAAGASALEAPPSAGLPEAAVGEPGCVPQDWGLQAGVGGGRGVWGRGV